MNETAVAERSHRKNYTDLEKDAALRAYLICSGHRESARELLLEQDIDVPASTIYYWATDGEKDKLETLRQQLGPQIKAQMAEVHQGLASAVARIEAKAINRLDEKLDSNEIEPKDLSAVMQRSAIATGIHSEKHLLYSGQPTQIVQRDASEVLRKLQSRGVVIDAEVVEETVAS